MSRALHHYFNTQGDKHDEKFLLRQWVTVSCAGERDSYYD